MFGRCCSSPTDAGCNDTKKSTYFIERGEQAGRKFGLGRNCINISK